MAIITTEALVLKRRDLRETSLLVSFFTSGYGKITGELKGVRADARKFGSTVDIFSLNDIVFYQKRNSQVHLVSQCDLKEGFPGVRAELSRITAAGAMCELLDGVLAPEDPHPALFALALEALKELSTSAAPDRITSIFKIKTISLSGFRPHLDSCVSCGTAACGRFRFSTKLGGLLCSRCQPKDTASRQVFRGTIATIRHIERNDFRHSLRLGMNPQIKRELDFMLNLFLEFHLGKRLKSDRLMESLKTAGGPQ